MLELCTKGVLSTSVLSLNIPLDRRNEVQALMEKCKKHNGYISVSLGTPRRPRTTGEGSQNHHLNGHIMQVCQATGNDYDTVKDAVKQIAAEQYGYPFKTVAGRVCPQKERDCSVEDCAKLIEAVHYLAADMGIYLEEE